MRDLDYITVKKIFGGDKVPAQRGEDDMLDLPSHCFLGRIFVSASRRLLSKQRLWNVEIREFSEESLEALGL